MRAVDREALAEVRARGAVPVPSSTAPVEVAQRLLIAQAVSLVRLPEGGLALVPYVAPRRPVYDAEVAAGAGEARATRPRARRERKASAILDSIEGRQERRRARG